MKSARKTAKNATSTGRPVFKGLAATAPAKRRAKAALDSEPAVSVDVSIMQRRTRFNPLRTLTAESLARALDSFRYGDMRWAAYLWEAMAEQDDVISSVKPKREKSIAHREWKVLIKDEANAEDAQAKKHQEILNRFWHSATASNAYDRNERGGISRLIRQMASAISFRYAVHHLVWKPAPGELRAEFEFVPLYFFENRSGELRFVRDGISTTGEPMEPQNWMITVGDGLMIAGSIAAYLKRLANQDWMAFSERFGTPGVVGRTRAGKDTDAGRAMADAVEQFGTEFSAVLYGDEGDGKIETIEAKANAGTIPMPVIVERLDKKIATLFRGADLSTISSSQGEGTGASLQLDETKILDRDDAAMITETLAMVERIVIAWHFGQDTEPLAGIKVLVPEEQDLTLLLKVICDLVDRGAPFEMADVLARFGFSLPKDNADLLKPMSKGPTAINARPRDKQLAGFREAIAKDNGPLAEALMKIVSAEGDEATRAAVNEAQQQFPEVTRQVLSREFLTTFFADLAGEEMLNQLEDDKVPDTD